MKDDFQFVEAALAGQKEAFGQLVERYQDRLIHAISRYLGSVEDAHDVAQDAFVQAYTRLASFRGEAAFYTWLYRIAFNLAMTRVRRRRPMQSLDQAKDSLGNEPTRPMELAGLYRPWLEAHRRAERLPARWPPHF